MTVLGFTLKSSNSGYHCYLDYDKFCSKSTLFLKVHTSSLYWVGMNVFMYIWLCKWATPVGISPSGKLNSSALI